MSIVYDWYENPNAEGDPEERGLHPRPLLNGKVTMKQLYARVYSYYFEYSDQSNSGYGLCDKVILRQNEIVFSAKHKCMDDITSITDG